jgi:hypothetical protein
MCPPRQRTAPASIPARTVTLANYAVMIVAGSVVTDIMLACAKNRTSTDLSVVRNIFYLRRSYCNNRLREQEGYYNESLKLLF